MKKGSIKKKLLGAVVLVIVVTILITSAIKLVSDLVVSSETDNILIEQAMDSAEVFVAGQTESVNEQIISITEKLSQAAQMAEYVYAHPEEYSSLHTKHVTEFPKDVKGVTYHWATFSDEDDKNPELVKEANLLSALQGEFYSLTKSCPMIQSIYIATSSHINIGYDENVLLKVEAHYNPIEAKAQWLLKPMENGKIYISDAYADTYGRGKLVTVSAPYFVNDMFCGVIGADISIQNIEENILDIDMSGISGYPILLASDGTPISAKDITEETTAKDILGENCDAIIKDFETKESDITGTKLYGLDKYIAYNTVETTGWKFGVVISVDDILAPSKIIENKIAVISVISIAITIVILAVILIIMGRFCTKFTKPILKLTEDVLKIGDGNLDYKSEIKTGDEIELLSDSFENMTVSLKNYISNLTEMTAEKERIGAELDVATHIQASMLPCIFPPFPDNKSFNIFASMNPAKEVGGDFYDFFMVDDTHLAIVVADVSGKGVPAALFMVIGKTLIKDHTVTGCDLGEVFTVVNDLLCEANSEGLFITAFEGVIDLKTGVMNYVNAGHETPFICHKGGKFEPHKVDAKFVLAGMDGMRYKAGTIQLEKGDKVFQYTDGVTEATDANNQLYGMQRLEEALARNADKSPEELLPAIKEDIDRFVGDAPQFDDITMLGVEYFGME